MKKTYKKIILNCVLTVVTIITVAILTIGVPIIINELYKEFNIHIINGKTCLCGDTNGRGFREELIITNY